MYLRVVNRLQWSYLPLVCFFLLSISSCSKQEKSTESTAAAPKTFTSADAAAQALVKAAQLGSRGDMLAIFGSVSAPLLYSGNSAQDSTNFSQFVASYNVMHRWRKLENGSELLLTGADNKAFPIPLCKNASGQWFFDTEAGKKEILARRIGRNELAAIDVCATIREAELEYYSQTHDGVRQFAQKFISDEGKQNGLYWQSTGAQPTRSPLGPLVAFGSKEGHELNPKAYQPFYGYYFQILSSQGPDAKGGAKNYIANGKMTGGFAVLAYPARYGDSGVMSFVINQNGVVYEKDLGKTTDQVCPAMTEFNPDKTWKIVGS